MAMAVAACEWDFKSASSNKTNVFNHATKVKSYPVSAPLISILLDF